TAIVVDASGINVNVGTGANQVVQLDGSSKLPAVDGSALVNLNGTNISSGTVADARLSSNVALKDAANAFTNANSIAVTTASKKALVLKSTDDDNTKNILEIQKNDGTVKVSLRPDGVPTAATDLVTKNYSDTTFITKTLPAAPGAGEDQKAIRWNNGAAQW